MIIIGESALELSSGQFILSGFKKFSYFKQSGQKRLESS